MQKPVVSMIAAMAQNRVIGVNNDLPWDIPEDLEYFRNMTRGKPCLMGRKTYESLPFRPLPKRPNIIITRDDAYDVPEGVLLAANIEDGLNVAKTEAERIGVDEIMVMGGGQIYKQALPFADRIYLTEIDAEIDGDTIFPEFSMDEWREVSRQIKTDHAPNYHFVVYERRV